MVKDKPIEPKKQAQATIKVQEVKEPEKKEEVQEKPILTVKERIDKVVDAYEDKTELKKQVFQLVQRILYPEQFCPDCDERMFFNPATSSYSCPNCGYESKSITTTPTPGGIGRVAPRPTGKVPEIVEKAIAEAAEAGRDIPIPTRPGALGDKIRKLVADRDAGGSSVPTKEAEAQLRSDKNVANKVNWV
jgi:ribosomal protein L37AE/L43A